MSVVQYIIGFLKFILKIIHTHSTGWNNNKKSGTPTVCLSLTGTENSIYHEAYRQDYLVKTLGNIF